MTSGPFHTPLRARRLADAAARRCLERTGRRPNEVELILNVGNYRDHKLAEPALVALVQEDIHANPGHPPVEGRHGTFSFDIGNGGCGALTAIHVASGFLASGSVRLAMVVASDSADSRRGGRSFPYQAAGGAILLRRDDDRPGFGDFRFATFPEFAGLSEGYYQWVGPRRHNAQARHRPHGRHVVVVRHRPGYQERAVDCSADVASDVLQGAGLTSGDVDLLLASHSPGFADALADRLGIDHGRVAHIHAGVERSHTVELPAVIDTAGRNGQLVQARTALVVSAAAGITVGAALYRR